MYSILRRLACVFVDENPFLLLLKKLSFLMLEYYIFEYIQFKIVLILNSLVENLRWCVLEND